MFGKKMDSAGKLDPVKKDAMLKVCDEIMGEMDGMMEEGLNKKKSGMSKVSVMADSKAGLESGLDKAEEIVEGDEENYMPEMESEDEEIDFSGLSEGQIDELLQKLMTAKEQKKVKAPF